MTEKKKVRVPEIDGIRGWAALCVLLYHLTWDLFGVLHPAFRHPVLKALLDGPLAVYVFFVLSGDALSVSFTTSGPPMALHKMAFKRYFRLAGPTLFSCLCVYALMKAGLTFNLPASAVVHRTDWLGSFLPFSPSLPDTVWYGLFQVFTVTTNANSISYNPFLWPMATEMGGSLIVFVIGSLYKELRQPTALLAAAAVFLTLFVSPLALFFAGVLLGRLRALGFFEKLQARTKKAPLSLLVLAAVFLFDAYGPEVWTKSIFAHNIMAFLIVASVYASRPMLAAMRSEVSAFLGKISFPLYYMQFPILVSWTSWEVVVSQSVEPKIYAAWFVIASSVSIAFLAAYAVERLEMNYLAFVDRMVSRLFKPAA